jgi:hypothetical protein
VSTGGDRDIEVGKICFEEAEGDPCDLCARLATELAPRPWEQHGSKGVDCACESCRAVLEVAQGLLDNKVEDENEIITTIALAANAGLTWTEKAEQPPDDFIREHMGLKFSSGGLLMWGSRPNCDSGEPDLWPNESVFNGAEGAYFDRS